MDLSKLSTEDLLALKAGDLSKVSTDGLMALRGGEAPAKPDAPPKSAAQAPSDSAVAVNSANKAIAAIPDALLNAPANILNLARAGIGTVAGMAGRPDMMPEVTPPPNLVSRGLRAAGAITDAEPKSARQRILDALVQGGVGMAVNPAQGLRQVAGSMIAGGVGGAAGQVAREAGAPDGVATSIAMLTPFAAQGARGAAMRRSEELALEKSRNAERDATLAAGREKGLVVPPSSTNPSFLNKRLESLAGKAAVGQEAAKRNQATVTDMAAEELGLPKGTPITEGRLEAFRDAASAPYRKLTAISPRAEALLQRLRQTRKDANAYFRHYDVSADPASQAKAQGLSQTADQLEGMLDKLAAKSGQAGLVDDMREARTKIAKSWDIERAMNVGDASVSAPSLGRSVDRGAPLSGNLELAGKFQQAFPSAMREGASVPSPGVSKSEAIIAALMGGGGAAAFGPLGAGLAALPLASGPARSLALSKGYQKLMGEPDYKPGMISRMAREIPQDNAVIQALLLARAMEERNRQ